MKKCSLSMTIVLFLVLAAGFPVSPAFAGSGARNGNDGSAESCCEKLMGAKRSIYALNDWSYKMAFQLRGIYTRDETIFFCLGIFNHSHIDYHVDSIRFYIADEKKTGRSTAGGTTLIPVCIYGNTRIIRGKTREFCVFALPGFTLPGKKLLVIDVSEHNGGRHLQLQANNSLLVKARLI